MFFFPAPCLYISAGGGNLTFTWPSVSVEFIVSPIFGSLSNNRKERRQQRKNREPPAGTTLPALRLLGGWTDIVLQASTAPHEFYSSR